MRDEEKSSMLPSMAAGLKTILFNITTNSPELDHVPKGMMASTEQGRSILGSIPLGGILRDSLFSSSLPGGYNGKPGALADSFVDQNMENYLEPVIVSPTNQTPGNTPCPAFYLVFSF